MSGSILPILHLCPKPFWISARREIRLEKATCLCASWRYSKSAGLARHQDRFGWLASQLVSCQAGAGG